MMELPDEVNKLVIKLSLYRKYVAELEEIINARFSGNIDPEEALRALERKWEEANFALSKEASGDLN